MDYILILSSNELYLFAHLILYYIFSILICLKVYPTRILHANQRQITVYRVVRRLQNN